jgi:SpoVK/Ycf46/Vps4 family AAA+-type ATPase
VQVPLPDEGQREAILSLILRKHASENAQPAMDPLLLSNQPEAGSTARPLRVIARGCEGFSGSDLVEMCSQAVSIPVHEALAALRSGSTMNSIQPVSMTHFETVLRTFRPATQLATRAEPASDPTVEQLIRAMLIDGLQQRMQLSDSQPDRNARKAP